MTRLTWGDDLAIDRGVDRCVWFVPGESPVAWNGVVSISENEESVTSSRFFNGAKYRNRVAPGSFSATVQAYTYPDILARRGNLTYRTMVNNGESYRIHLVYNALLLLSDKEYATVGDSADPLLLSLDLSTKPELYDDLRISRLIVHVDRAYPWVVSQFEDLLYGTDTTQPVFPTVDEVLDVFEEGAIVKITDNGDGTWTADGPDSAVYMTSATEFAIDWPSVVYIDEDTYIVRSL